MSALISIVDRIVTVTNGESFLEAFVATREYAPALDTVTASSGVVVQVIPKARAVAALTRQGGPVENRYEVDIGVFKAATGTKAQRDAIADSMMELVEQIQSFWVKQDFIVDAVEVMNTNQLIEPIFDLELLRDKGIFASVITLQLQEVR